MGYSKGGPKPYKVLDESKYTGNPDRVVCRSSWETKVCKSLDGNSAVRKWSSEELVIPYICATDGKPHRYFPDFVIELADSRKYIVEVKPKSECSPPKLPKNGVKSKAYIKAALTYAKNVSKWRAANEYAKKTGRQFVIWTEEELVLLLRPGAFQK